MKKQTVLWTAVPAGVTEGGNLKLSLVISPRLWTDAAPYTLQQFPDFIDWPATLAGLQLTVQFEGGAAIAEPKLKRLGAAPDSELWKAVFTSATTLTPHQFEEQLSNKKIRSFPARAILADLKSIYQDVALTSPTELPTVEAPVYTKLKALAFVANEGRPDPELGIAAVGPDSRTPGRSDIVNPVIQPGAVINPGAAVNPAGRSPIIRAPNVENRVNQQIVPRAGSAAAPIASGPAAVFSANLAQQAALSRQAVTRVESLLQANRVISSDKVAGLSAEERFHVNFRQVKVFHERLSNAKRTPIVAPKIDFHRMIASLGQYPELMRRLGLVIDIDLGIPPSGAPASSNAAPKSVSVKWPPASTNEGPKTRYVTAPSFTAASRTPGAEKNGMLPLAGNDYDLVQVDIDSAALKTMEFASNMVRASTQLARTRATRRAALPPLESGGVISHEGHAQVSPALASTPSIAGTAALKPISYAQLANPAATTEAAVPKAGPPPLQSAGLSVIHLDRAVHLRSRLDVSRQMNTRLVNPTDEVFIYKEDLVRGYRVDVWDNKTKQWHSLNRRAGTYRFLNAPAAKQTLQIEDEGFVQMGATTSQSGPADPDLNLHEVLFRWTGWSLSAPRPGKAISEDNVAVDARPKATTEFKLETSFKAVKGSLPRLRFGVEYRMRARVVDLAGNSLPHTFVGDFSTATDSLVYKRFEPVSWPMVVPREALQNNNNQPLPGKEGESVERLVIRSFNDAPAKDTQKTPQATERHVAPPKTSQVMAETFGMFDKPSGPDPAVYTAASTGPDPSAYATFIAKDASLKEAEPGAQLEVPYLPDPLARGATLKGLPGLAAGALKQVPYAFNGAWPRAQTFRLRVEEGTGAPVLAGGVLTVFVPKAEAVRVHLSSHLAEKDLDLSGHWQWIDERKPANLANLRGHAYQGCHWIFTPCRELVLVHAVQQPLITPDLKSIKPIRYLGQTFAVIQDQFPISGKSTIRVDIRAEWDEPVDNPRDPKNNPATARRSGKANLPEVRVDADDTTVNFSQRHEFHDTKHRRVRYQAIAATRFREYFPISLTGDPNNPADMEAKKKNVTRSSPWQEISVPNAARPDAPVVRYVIPMFKWEKSATSKTRRGGLRVYLERPWFSSGEGELLGVVIYPAPSFGRILDKFRPYVTQWGSDPIWKTSAPDSAMKLGTFMNAVDTGYNLSLDELQPARLSSASGMMLTNPGALLTQPAIRINPQIVPRIGGAAAAAGNNPSAVQPSNPIMTPADKARATAGATIVDPERVVVVGHKVEYDAERELWYCDIDMDIGDSYFPFVRLALARYQPNSVPDAHLSRVVLADFVQLTPDRTVSVTSGAVSRDAIAATPTTVLNVAVAGIAPRADDGRANQVEVSVEMRDPNVTGDLGWIPADKADVKEEKTGGGLAAIGSLAGARPAVPTIWTGKVTLPESRAAAAKKYRLVIKEYEVLIGDPRPIKKPGGPGLLGSFDLAAPGTNPTWRRRLVYADTLEL